MVPCSSEAADVELSDEFKMVHIVAMMFAAGQGVELNSVHILLGLLGSKLVPKYSGESACGSKRIWPLLFGKAHSTLLHT